MLKRFCDLSGKEILDGEKVGHISMVMPDNTLVLDLYVNEAEFAEVLLRLSGDKASAEAALKAKL